MTRRLWEVNATLPVSFKVEHVDDLLSPDDVRLVTNSFGEVGGRRLVIVDERVYKLWGSRIDQYFIRHAIDYHIVPIACSETLKDVDTLMAMLGAMESFHLLRQSEPVLAIGGGVLLDAVGFAASIYRRGVPYIRVPTTLLALVDASVGAKTSVNHFGRRNRLGAYHVPVASYLDRTFLTTLERVEFSNGLAEILKMSLIKDRRLFELLEASGKELIDERFQSPDVAGEVIDRAITTMLEELEPNLWEKDLKRSVDFGHSFSPVIEMRALPELSHGQAVTLDVLFSCLLSHRRGLLSLVELERIITTVEGLELPVFHPFFGEPEVLWEALADTMLHRNGNQNLPMIPTIGSVTFFDDVTMQEIEHTAIAFRELLGDRKG